MDYLKEYPNTNAQEIRFGSNLLDFTKDFDMTDIATVVRPRGAKINDMSTSRLEDIGYTETEINELRALSEKVDNRLDVTKVNGGSPYVANEEGISSFGWIEVVVDWDGITNPEELLEKAQTYLSEEQFNNMVIEVSAVDLRYLSKYVQSINLLDTVRCVSRPHGMDKSFPVSELSIQLDKPESSTYKLGDRVNGTFTGSSRAENAEILDKISKIPNEKTMLDKAQDNASQILNLATQGYVTIIKNQYGSQSLVVSADKTYNSETDLWSSSTKLWRWNINGLGYSTNGGRTYGTAITMNGAIVADYITTGTMSANRIRTGILQDEQGNSNWNLTTGVLTMKKGSITLGVSSSYPNGDFQLMIMVG